MPAPRRLLPLAWLLGLAVLASGCTDPGTSAAAPAADLSLGQTPLHQQFAGQLQRLDPSGQWSPATVSPSVRRVIFAFSAHWCPPCRAYTPQLAEWYRAHHRADSDWDLILVSQDHSADQLLEYAQETQMPWLVLDWETARSTALLDPIRPRGIPATALVAADGQVLAHSFDAQGNYHGPQAAPDALQALLTKESAAPAAPSPPAPASR